MRQFQIGDLVRNVRAGFPAYVIKKYLFKDDPECYYDIYYWNLQKESPLFREWELEPLTTETVNAD